MIDRQSTFYLIRASTGRGIRPKAWLSAYRVPIALWIFPYSYLEMILSRTKESPAIPKNYEAYWKRAEDGTRTRDPNLGKVMLYQLSYFRRRIYLYSKRDLNPHGCNSQRILSPSCLPIPPFEHPISSLRVSGRRDSNPRP